MSELTEPLCPAAARHLRTAVLELRRREPRRWRFPARIHVGTPGGVQHWFEEERGPRRARLDHALRVDIVAALLDRTLREQPPEAGPSAWTWLSRAGSLTTEDIDGAWQAAALAAYGELSLPPTMVVVTRQGWRDPRSELSRTWLRLRDRR